MLPPWLQRDAVRSLLALLAGGLSTLAFAPFHFWPLAIISTAIFCALLQNTHIKQALWRGWCFGFGFFVTAVSWVYVSIHQFGSASVVVAGTLTLLFAAGLAIFFALHGLAYQQLNSRIGANLSLLAVFPAIWILAEWFRSWFLTGFPWLLLGYAPMDTPLAGWASITGVYGLSYFVALAAAALVWLWLNCSRRNSVITATLVSAPFFLGYPLQQLQFVEAKAAPVSVTLIQGNTPQELKWQARHRQRIIDTYVSMTMPALESQLIIWPETAVPQLLAHAEPELTRLDSFLKEYNTALLTGVPSSEQYSGTTRYYNSVIALGTAAGIYHKQRLVPFGEYVPLESLLRGLIDFFDLPMSSFSLGPSNQQPIRLQNGSLIAPYICYEVVYPDLVASEPGDILLTVSNDSWFGDSLAPQQHLQMARMRAMENQRYMIRATNNGISAFIAPDGKLLSQTEQFIATSLSAEVQAQTGLTPFSRTGSWPILGFAGFLVLMSLTSGCKNRKTYARTSSRD